MLTTEAPVISVMTVNPITVQPNTSIAEARAKFSEHKIRHLPVLDGDNTLVGILSMTDLAMLEKIHDSPSEEELCCEDLMSKEVIGLSPDDTIGLAADLFLSKLLHAAPVLDEGELVGIVTSHDLLRRVFADVLPLDNTRAA